MGTRHIQLSTRVRKRVDPYRAHGRRRAVALCVLALCSACGTSPSTEAPPEPDNAFTVNFTGAVSGSFTLSDVAGGGATTSELLSAPTVSTYWNESFPIMTLVLTRPTSGRRIDMFRISFPRNTGVFQVDTKAVQMFLYLGIAVDSSNLSAGLHPDSAFFISTGNPPGGPPVSGAMSVNRLLLSGKGIQEMEATFNGTGPRGTDGQAVTVTGALTIRKASSTRGVGKLCALLTAC